MKNLTFVYQGSARDLRKIINALLKSGIVKMVYKINYGQHFFLEDKKIVKSDMKFLIIWVEDELSSKDFLSKNFPQIKELKLNQA